MLFGNGTGGFGAPTTIRAPASSPTSAPADFNSDGRPDLAIVAGNVLYPALQFDAGTFAAPANLAVPLTAPGVRLVVRDLNGDGNTDVVVSPFLIGSSAASGPDSVTIHFGNGLGGFTSQATLPLGQDTWISTVSDLGDLNGDGHRDLGVAQFNTNRLVLLLGNGAGVFTPQLLSNAPAGIVLDCQWRHQRRQPARRRLQHDGWPRLFSSATGRGALRRPSPSRRRHRVRCVSPTSTPTAASTSSSAVTARRMAWSVLLNLCGQPSTDLALSLTDSPDPVVEGNTVTYSATVTNLGPNAAPNATYVQVLPTGYTGTAAASAGTRSVAGRLVTCSLGLLASGGR